MESILAIDQGSHATRALLYDMYGRRLLHLQKKIHQQRISPQCIEVDAWEVLQTVVTLIQRCTCQTDTIIRHAGLAVQRSTLVAWDTTSGHPLAPALSWQDTRCASLLKPLQSRAAQIQDISGLPLSAHYLAGKILWLLQYNADVAKASAQGRCMFGPLASFLAFHLLRKNPCIVDHSNAARSLLFNLEQRQWDSQLLQWFGIDEQQLPRCTPTLFHHGTLVDTEIPLCCLCGDQNAAMHAHGALFPERLQINLGSGGFVLQSCGTQWRSIPTMISGIAWSDEQQAEYLLEGSVNGVGNALSWLQQSTEVPLLQALPQWLEETHPSVWFLNSIGGIGAPYWQTGLPAQFIPEGAPLAARAVALVESVVFLLQKNLETLSLHGIRLIRISGGLSQLNGLCQRIADLSQRPVERSDDPEATARGLAWLAAGRPGDWRVAAVKQCFQPRENPDLHARYRQFLQVLENKLTSTKEAS